MNEKKKIKIEYNPDDAGKQIVNSKGKVILLRKYHLTDEEMNIYKERFEKNVKDVPQDIKDKAGSYFFNPYRSRGIYYSQIQALYLLGANEWHSYVDVKEKIKEFASSVELTKRERSKIYKTNVWKEFEEKTARPNSIASKDLFGRINENMIFFQRLGKLNPYGYKLHQVRAAVDIKRVQHEKFPNGLFFYRLSTYDNIEDAYPIKDNSNFPINKKRGRKLGSKNRKKEEVKNVPVI